MKTRVRNIFGLACVFVMLNGCSFAEEQKAASEVIQNTGIIAEKTQESSVAEESNTRIQEIQVPETELQGEEVETLRQQEKEITEWEVPEETNKREADVTELEQAEQNEVVPADSFYAVYSESEMNEALEQGDLVTYFQMLNANSAATMVPAAEDYADVAVNEREQNSFLSTEFIDYLNVKRAEQNLPPYAWSESMANTALERAAEITEDFSHNGVRNCAGENIAMMNNSNTADWYDAFYSSEVHKQNMLDSTYHSAAAAVCQVGNSHYVVVLFGF